MNAIKLNNFLSRLKRRTPMTGAFRQTLAEFDHRKIVLVTCVGNEDGNEGYDPSAECIDGSYYELHDANQVRSFSFANDLKLCLKHMIDVDNIKDWGDVVEQAIEESFVEEVNRILGNGAIKVTADPDANGVCYKIAIDSPFINTSTISPSDELLNIIINQSSAILGKTPTFNNTNHLFWFD